MDPDGLETANTSTMKPTTAPAHRKYLEIWKNTIGVCLGVFLLAGCLAGYASQDFGKTAADVAHPNAGKTDIHPEKFVASIGGFLGASYRVELQPDGTLLYQHNPQTFVSGPGTKSARIEVADERWREFRRALDEARVWRWESDYSNTEIQDGTLWSLNIEYPDAAVISRGSNRFPPGPGFQRFQEAVEKLLGGRVFR